MQPIFIKTGLNMKKNSFYTSEKDCNSNKNSSTFVFFYFLILKLYKATIENFLAQSVGCLIDVQLFHFTKEKSHDTIRL